MMRDLPDITESDSTRPRAENPGRQAHAPVRPIGEIIRVVTPLTDSDVAHILDVQERLGVRFGEAAQALSLASREDVLWALSQQFGFPYPRGPGHLDNKSLVVLSDPYGGPAEAIRELRSQIIALSNDGERRALAVVSPASGDGRTFIAANLALSFCQAGERTVLVDANLRNPGIHKLLGVPERPSLSTLLCGEPVARPFDRSPQMPLLRVLQAGTPPPNPLELLDQPMLRRLLTELAQQFDRVIVDTPPARGSADARVIAAACGQAVLVGRRHHSAAGEMDELNARLRKVGVGVVGLALNNR